MDKINKKRLGWMIKGAVFSGLIGLGLSQANAGIVFDLRAATGDGKTISAPGVGNTVTLNLYADVSNTDNDHTNDGFTQLNAGLLSTESSTGVMGNFSALTINSQLAPGSSQGGVPTNLDGNPDLELGDTTANAGTATNWVIINATSTLGPVFGTGSGSGVTEFLLGSLTWTETSAGDGSATSLQTFIRPRTSGTPSQKQMVKYVDNGTTEALVYNDPLISFGTPVSVGAVVTPEPASLGLLAVVGCGLIRRRRRA